MRLQALVLPALLLALACKSDPGDESGESSSGAASCSGEVVGDVDPNYPPCGCSPDFCAEGSQCKFSGLSQPEWVGSVCLPECKLGPTCGNPEDPCKDSDCPTLAGITPTCSSGLCFIYCDEADPCPAGYLCGEAGHCQVSL